MPSREDTRQALGDTNTVDCVKHRETQSEVVSSNVLTAAMSGLTVSTQVQECVDVDDDKMPLAAGDSGSDTVGMRERGAESESDTLEACAAGDVNSQDNNSNNIVTGPEGDGGVVRHITAINILCHRHNHLIHPFCQSTQEPPSQPYNPLMNPTTTYNPLMNPITTLQSTHEPHHNPTIHS
ncbi:hypothetical protein NP493_1121g00030 [Ridgeia piscesae]|uniref:Uncharacterized protein n=1 Tax=Ridgeia piscesae TaxID=27915 RepID=A0AAD9KGV9_RIDPI|nr:hypothetical protein NP493_1121g00030 [Ridgeia piscesae]